MKIKHPDELEIKENSTKRNKKVKDLKKILALKIDFKIWGKDVHQLVTQSFSTRTSLSRT